MYKRQAASAAIIYGCAAESVCGKSQIANWQPPAGTRLVVFAADNDKHIGESDAVPTVNDEFVDRAIALQEKGFGVAVVMPNHGRNDFNDLLMADPSIRRPLPKPFPVATADGSVDGGVELDTGPETVDELHAELKALVAAGEMERDVAKGLLEQYAEYGYATT